MHAEAAPGRSRRQRGSRDDRRHPRRTGGVVTVYWFYRRSGGATLVLSLDAKGVVKAITLSGSLPYPSGRTSRSIGLGNDYTDVIQRYGYPDQSLSQSSALDLDLH